MENFLNVKHYWKDIKMFKLQTNYRSKAHIVAAWNSVIKNNKNQYEKNIIAHREGSDKITVFTNNTDKIDDMIKLPTTMDNPKCVYKKLDSDKRNFHPKFDNIVLYQSCYDGIITCEYNIRIMLEMDTLFSTNEFLEIPLDFY